MWSRGWRRFWIRRSRAVRRYGGRAVGRYANVRAPRGIPAGPATDLRGSFARFGRGSGTKAVTDGRIGAANAPSRPSGRSSGVPGPLYRVPLRCEGLWEAAECVAKPRERLASAPERVRKSRAWPAERAARVRKSRDRPAERAARVEQPRNHAEIPATCGRELPDHRDTPAPPAWKPPDCPEQPAARGRKLPDHADTPAPPVRKRPDQPGEPAVRPPRPCTAVRARGRRRQASGILPLPGTCYPLHHPPTAGMRQVLV